MVAIVKADSIANIKPHFDPTEVNYFDNGIFAMPRKRNHQKD